MVKSMDKKCTKPTVRNYLILFAMSLSVLVLAFNTTAQTNALLIIKREFNISPTSLQWVINIYLLMATSFILIAGKIGDYFEKKKVFISACLLYLFASVFIALSANAAQLLIWRAVQGLFAAFICSGSMSILKTQFDDDHLIWAIGIWSAMVGIGAAIGPYGGGVISDTLSWRYIFWLNTVIMLIASSITLFSMKSEGSFKKNIRVDVKGLILFFIFASTLVFAFSYSNVIGWKNLKIPSLIIISLITGIIFFKYETKHSDPLVHFEFFKNKVFLFANVGIFTTILSEVAIPYFFNIYLQNSTIFDYSASKSGMLLLPFTTMILLSSLLSSYFVKRLGSKLIIILSFLLISLGLIILSYSGIRILYSGLILGMILTGAGMGLVNPLLSSIALSSLPEKFLGEASGVLNTIAYFGEIVAITVGNIIFFTVGRKILFPIVQISKSYSMNFYDQLLLGYKLSVNHYLSNLPQIDKTNCLNIIQNSAKLSFSSILIFIALLTFSVILLSIFFVILNKKDKIF